MDITESLYEAVLQIAHARRRSFALNDETQDFAHDVWLRLLPKWRATGENPHDHMGLIAIAITRILIDAFRKKEGEKHAVEIAFTTSFVQRSFSRREWVEALDVAIQAVQSVTNGFGLGRFMNSAVRKRLENLLVLKASPEDFSRDELAERLDCSTGTVSNDLHLLQNVIVAAWRGTWTISANS